MAQLSSIEWTDATWNPTRGCSKIAPGCARCYAETFAERFRGVKGHPYELGFDPRIVPEKLGEPLSVKKPTKFFVDSMSDLFHEAFTFEYIAAVFGVMTACADRDLGHIFQVLTKRMDRALQFFRWLDGNSGVLGLARAQRQTLMHEAVKSFMGYDNPERPAVNLTRGWPLPNVWIGTSIANQTDAEKNVVALLNAPAAIHFVSYEPAIGPVNLNAIRVHQPKPEPWQAVSVLGDLEHIDALRGSAIQGRFGFDTLHKLSWVIVGGESGNGARPCNVEWIRSIVSQCKAADVPVFVKQLGAKPTQPLSSFEVDDLDLAGWPDGTEWTQPDDGHAHPVLDARKGGDWNEWPADLRIRQFPREVAA